MQRKTLYRMKKVFFAFSIVVLLCSHTMFLKLNTYFVAPNTAIALQLFNGTFEKSENVIDRDRMIDASILSAGVRKKVTDAQWTEKDSTTFLNFKTGAPGTYVVGVSTKARSLAMEAKAFNDYLEHEGIYDMLEWRKQNNALNTKAVEKYSKHVKTIFQVGTITTDDWQEPLGYPIEFIPLENPYELHTGDSLAVKLLLKGKPVANQLVYADYRPIENGHSHDTVATNENHGHSHNDKANAEHTHGNSEPHSHDATVTAAASPHSHDGEAPHTHKQEEKEASHTHATGQQLRTNANGIAKAHLSADGIWYFQTIHLVQTEEEGLTHESNWTTLTFETTHAHSAATHTHEDDHEHENNYLTYVILIGSIILIGALFLWFNSQKKTNE